MKFVTLAALFGLPSCLAAGTGFSFDPSAPDGPEYWASLSSIPGNQCGGPRNSPVAINSENCEVTGDYKFTDGTCDETLAYSINGVGVKASYSNVDCTPSFMNIPGNVETFNVLQFHIHLSSEHNIDGQHYGAELHIVHTGSANPTALAVVGLLINGDGTEEHPLFEKLLVGWESIAEATVASPACDGVDIVAVLYGTGQGSGRNLVAGFNVDQLIPKNTTFYTYPGGLTTPPCTQSVAWNVASEPVSITVRQFNRLTNLILGTATPETCELATVASPTGSTSRPPQPLNGRKISRICPVGYTGPGATAGTDKETDTDCENPDDKETNDESSTSTLDGW
eukprot:CAMPEP_0116832486 /NCGR_PEP_ID=MMETSP0418-20121206/5919_1 /TAXON_ID=1158023 /ORGANISM="Astrosyne radiata, Strain 13vi08-1A" /LENGTH=338 /DNA_ID=CAMNT_0004461853 /DNA_START=12 /DNA_END=1026 /DNA_ORIENTATION=+